jgi:hypothetical protein
MNTVQLDNGTVQSADRFPLCITKNSNMKVEKTKQTEIIMNHIAQAV